MINKIFEKYINKFKSLLKKIEFTTYMIAAILGCFLILLSFFTFKAPQKEIKVQYSTNFMLSDTTFSPYALAISDDDQYIFISSLNNNKIQKFKILSYDSWKFETSWGEEGDKPGQFRKPSGIYFDKNKNIYVADTYNDRIQKFSNKGKFLSVIELSNKDLYRPTNVSIDNNGILYVANTGKHNICRFNPKGKLVGDLIKFPGEIFGLAMDSMGRIYVVNLWYNAVEVYYKDFSLIKRIKIPSWIKDKSQSPMIALDSRDRLYVVSELEKIIYVYNTKNFEMIGFIRNDINNKPLFSSPSGIALDSQDSIFVADKAGNKVILIKPQFD